MTLLLATLLGWTLLFSCGDESEGGNANNAAPGPENAIENNASEAEFTENVDRVVETFDDFDEAKKKFVGDSSSSLAGFSLFRSMSMDDSETTVTVEGSDETIDPDELKKNFANVESCQGSFQVTDKAVAEFKGMVEEMIKTLKEGKWENDEMGSEGQSSGFGGPSGVKLVKVESDDAIAYDIQMEQPEGTEGADASQDMSEFFSMSGRVSGRYNKDESLFQFYQKFDNSIDYAGMFEKLKAQNPEQFSAEGMGDFFKELDFTMTTSMESTIEGNTEEKTFKATHYMKNDFASPSNPDQNNSVTMTMTSNLTGGDKPFMSQIIEQEVTNIDGTQKFNYDFSIAMTATDEFTVKVIGDAGEDEKDFSVEYKLTAGDTAAACALEKEETE
jgi:hypothetical protein